MHKIVTKKNKTYKLINQHHKKRYPIFFKNNITGIYFICHNINNIKLNEIYFPNNYYIFIILLNNINFTHKLSNTILVISHNMKRFINAEISKSVIKFCKKYDNENIIHIQNFNINCLENSNWLFKTEMGDILSKNISFTSNFN